MTSGARKDCIDNANKRALDELADENGNYDNKKFDQRRFLYAMDCDRVGGNKKSKKQRKQKQKKQNKSKKQRKTRSKR